MSTEKPHPLRHHGSVVQREAPNQETRTKPSLFNSASTLHPSTKSMTKTMPTTSRPSVRIDPNIIPRYSSNRPNEKVLREMEIREFYKNYDAMEGVLTAVVLGGFFAFVCLLVMYKTKCKPMWKNRRKRLTTTPATASVAEVDDPMLGPVSNQSQNQPPVIQQQFGSEGQCQFDEEDYDCDEEFGFECIPLQSVCNEEDSNDDIYFLDEFGNYVFPVSSSPNNVQGSCSCPPSAEELNSTLRRVSQVSSAYTVKSLPGAYLYIPVLESNQPLQSVPSLPSVKRALSDPQIHFASPTYQGGHPIILTVNPSSDTASEMRRRNNVKNRKLMALGSRSFSVNVESVVTSSTENAVVAKSEAPISGQHLAELNIDINVIQPTPNISPSASLRSIDEHPEEIEAEIPPVEKPVAKVPESTVMTSPKGTRRVSFSEDEVTSVSSDPAGDAPPSKMRRGSRGGSLATSLRQMTVPMAANATMSYLQVPGQQLVAPHLTSEAVAAQTSPQARRRRSTRLLKSGSFCSITSEGDGDIFGDDSASKQPQRGSTSSSSCKFDALSDYSELHNDDASSDISDLFLRPLTSSPPEQPRHQTPQAQQAESESGSIEDITYEVPTVVPIAKLDKEDVSSVSLSIGSEDNNHQQIITVPVTIEHPPPELRPPSKAEAACQQNTPASIAHHFHSRQPRNTVSAENLPEEEPGMRMVLVRDIGIQVCGDSPNLNLARKLNKGHVSGNGSQQRHKAKQDSLAEKFPAEILF